LIFLGTAVVTDVQGFLDPVVSRGRAPTTGPEGSPWIAVVLSFPVAMALATGTEAPATAMAQLGQLGLADRRRFARTTIMLTLLIVAALTLGLSELAVRLHVGIPKHDSTQIADIAHAAAGKGAAYALFQAASALLLLAAAARGAPGAGRGQRDWRALGSVHVGGEPGAGLPVAVARRDRVDRVRPLRPLAADRGRGARANRRVGRVADAHSRLGFLMALGLTQLSYAGDLSRAQRHRARAGEPQRQRRLPGRSSVGHCIGPRTTRPPPDPATQVPVCRHFDGTRTLVRHPIEVRE
jgi:hypothetical protein